MSHPHRDCAHVKGNLALRTGALPTWRCPTFGRFVPGFIKDTYGNYRPFLFCCVVYLALQFLCFIFLFFAHPIGAPSTKDKALEMT